MRSDGVGERVEILVSSTMAEEEESFVLVAQLRVIHLDVLAAKALTVDSEIKFKEIECSRVGGKKTGA